MGAAVALFFCGAAVLVTLTGVGLAEYFRRKALAARRAAAPISEYERLRRRYIASGLPEDLAAMQEALGKGPEEEG